jgi:hypothetical protein
VDKLHDAALAAIHDAQAAEQAATAGPWGEDRCNMTAESSGEWYIFDCYQHDDDALFYQGGYGTEADVHLVRAMRNGWPAVLAGYERQVRYWHSRWIAAGLLGGDADDERAAATQLRALCLDIADALQLGGELKQLASEVK